MKIRTYTRREFLEHLKRYGALGLLGTSTMKLLSSCTSTDSENNYLTPPGIVDNSLGVAVTNYSSYGLSYAYTTGTGPTYLIFGGYNPESGFSGYNIRYGLQAAILNDYAAGTKTTVIDPNTGTPNILNCASIGSGSYPSFPTSATINQFYYIQIQITGTGAGNYLYVSAYNLSDNIESALSNGYAL